MPVSDWFCCLNPGERQCLRTCALALAASGGVGILCEIYEAYWLTISQSRDARRLAFLEIFHLVEEAIEPIPGEPLVCFYVPQDAFLWLEIALFVASPQGACLNDCERWYPP